MNESQIEEMQRESGVEDILRKRIAELESALTLAIHWLDDDTPMYIVNELKTIRGDE